MYAQAPDSQQPDPNRPKNTLARLLQTLV